MLLILSDDQGYGELGFCGNPHLRTPHLDSLKNVSTHFENFYVDPVCAPSRAALLTGQYAIRNGIYDTFNGGSIMSGDARTVAEYLKQGGYRTGIFGKWHLGDNYPSRPDDQGFDLSIIHKGGGIGQPGDVANFFEGDSSYFDPIIFRNDSSINSEGYCTTVFTNHAIDFIEAKESQPFLAYVAYNVPHDPWQVPKEDLDVYANLDFDGQGLSQKQKENVRRIYGMIYNMDQNIGRLLSAVNQLETDRNTLIIFLSDNGPTSDRFNAGLRGHKGQVYEGGIKVPFLISYSGVFERQSVATPAAHFDVLPTILDLCSISYDPDHLDGKSLVPVMAGQARWHENERMLVWQWNRGFPELYKNTAIRKGDYKLIGTENGEIEELSSFELYNVKEDPFEVKNLIKEQPQIARELISGINDWYDRLVIDAGNPVPQTIIFDQKVQSSIQLNRNDARGTPDIWINDSAFTYWNIEFVQSGYYDITFDFRDNAGMAGDMIVNASPYQYTLRNNDTSATSLTRTSCFMKAGEYQLEAYYKVGFGEVVAPFALTIKSIGNGDAKIRKDY